MGVLDTISGLRRSPPVSPGLRRMSSKKRDLSDRLQTSASWTTLEQMSSVETGQMSAVETGQMSAAETGQMSAVPESSSSAWACGAYSGAPRRGLTREKEFEEGGDSVQTTQDGERTPSFFRCF